MRVWQWVWYSIERLALIAVPLVVFLLLGLHWILATILATVIGMTLSLLLLYRQRSALSTSIYEHRRRPAPDDGPSVHDADADYENALLDNAQPKATLPTDRKPAAGTRSNQTRALQDPRHTDSTF